MKRIALRDIFEGMVAKAFDANEAQHWEAVIQYDITGEERGKYYIEVKDQKCSLHEGEAEDPSLAITVSKDDWIAIIEGRLSGQEAFMTGRMKVEGNMNDLFRMATAFRTNGEVNSMKKKHRRENS